MQGRPTGPTNRAGEGTPRDDGDAEQGREQPRPPRPDEAVCAACGEPVRKDDIFCPHCGMSLVSG